MATAIERLLADPELRFRMGEAVQARVRQRFTMEQTLTAVQTIYRGLLPS